MTGKTKKKTDEQRSNSSDFERDLWQRHHERDLYKPGMYTRRFTITEGIPIVERDHEANKNNVVETARNEGIRTETVDKVELVSDEYLDDGRRELVYAVPVVEAMVTEDIAKAADNTEYGSYDPANEGDLTVSFDNSPSSETEGTKTATTGVESSGGTSAKK